MSGLILCGKKAKTPYYIRQIDKNIYSVEELQYYIYNNIHMLNKDFITDSLLDFLNDQLELAVTAQKIKSIKEKNGSFDEMIMVLLSTGAYYEPEELRSFEKVLKELNSMSYSQRIKSKADNLFEEGKYNKALKTYVEILSGSGKNENSDEFLAKIWNNMAAVYAKMFLYKEAYRCLKIAGDLNPATEIMDRLVVAALLSEDGKIMDDLVSQYGITEIELEEYKTAVEYERKHIRSSREHIKISGTLSFKNHEDINQYYNQIESIFIQWKNRYREENS